MIERIPGGAMVRHLTAAALVCVAGSLIYAQSSKQTASKQIITMGSASNLNLPFSPAVKADGIIYVAGTMSQEGGDIKAQTKWCLEDLDRTLKAAGSTLQHAASINVYLKNQADFAAMNEVYRTFFKDGPPARTTIVADLVIANGLVEMSAVGIPAGGERVAIHPSDWAKSPNPYSYGIRSGNSLFLAGLISRNGKDNSVVEGDISTQVKTAMDNAGQILKAAGYGFSDVVAVRNYISDSKYFAEMNKVYQGYFPKDPPARATVVAPLTAPQYLFETTMVAVKGQREAVTTPAADGTPGKPNPNLSSAIKVGNRLYLSGLLGNTADNKGDITAQTREVLARAARTLKAGGFDWTHVVDSVVYITDVPNFAGMNTGYRTIFTKDFPARATVETGLVAPDGLVEIMFTAVK
jgi:enamine deaminase RidA (YjgF/YER057c/UK114 family)